MPARARTRLTVDSETPTLRAMRACSIRRLRNSTVSNELHN
jgi:hypothetical protein